MRRSAILRTRLGPTAAAVSILAATACGEGDGGEVLGPEPGGAIEVRVSTIGTAPSAGYYVTVAGLTRPVAVTGMSTFRNLSAGPYSVELTGVTRNLSTSVRHVRSGN